MPVGYDGHVDGARTSVVMQQFGTGGTPWTVVIGRDGIVQMNEFTPSPDKIDLAIQAALTAKKTEPPQQEATTKPSKPTSRPKSKKSRR